MADDEGRGAEIAAAVASAFSATEGLLSRSVCLPLRISGGFVETQHNLYEAFGKLENALIIFKFFWSHIMRWKIAFALVHNNVGLSSTEVSCVGVLSFSITFSTTSIVFF